MGMRGRQLLLWITPPEEEVLVERVRALVPGLRLIDGGIWPTRTPPLLDRIADATGGRVALWDPGLAGEVECRPTTDGRFRCEAAGYVIWTEPSRVTELGLLGVHVVAGPLTEAQVAFADGCGSLVRRQRKVPGRASERHLGRSPDGHLADLALGPGWRSTLVNGRAHTGAACSIERPPLTTHDKPGVKAPMRRTEPHQPQRVSARPAHARAGAARRGAAPTRSS